MGDPGLPRLRPGRARRLHGLHADRPALPRPIAGSTRCPLAGRSLAPGYRRDRRRGTRSRPSGQPWSGSRTSPTAGRSRRSSPAALRGYAEYLAGTRSTLEVETGPGPGAPRPRPHFPFAAPLARGASRSRLRWPICGTPPAPHTRASSPMQRQASVRAKWFLSIKCSNAQPAETDWADPAGIPSGAIASIAPAPRSAGARAR